MELSGSNSRGVKSTQVKFYSSESTSICPKNILE